MRLILTIFMLAGFTLLQAQIPEISYVGSHYKTSSGAIGPKGIVATHTFNLKINSDKSLILDRLFLSPYILDGQGLIVPTNLEALIELTVTVRIHQKEKVWYTASITHKDVTVPVEVKRNTESIPSDPAAIIYLKTSLEEHTLIKMKFDSESNVYNK